MLKLPTRRTSRLVIAAGVLLLLLFWVIDAAFDRAFFLPGHSFVDCLFHPRPEAFWDRLLAAGLFLLLVSLAALLLRRKERDEAKLRNGRSRLEDLAQELAGQNARLEHEIARRQEMENQLASLVVTDPLTGIHNRRKFDEDLREELLQEARYPRGLALLMLDIDHFKAINDRYGHAAGDAVLIALARLVDEAIRESDRFFRIGGEEFAILTFAPEAAKLAVAAEKVRDRVAGHAFPAAGRLTVSLGGSLYRPGDGYDSLCKRADDALYAAKAAGRNRVVIGDGSSAADAPQAV
jgi:diguanylate cyclase (GGDEF)-like protein